MGDSSDVFVVNTARRNTSKTMATATAGIRSYTYGGSYLLITCQGRFSVGGNIDTVRSTNRLTAIRTFCNA